MQDSSGQPSHQGKISPAGETAAGRGRVKAGAHPNCGTRWAKRGGMREQGRSKDAQDVNDRADPPAIRRK